jgi:serine protease
MPNNVWGVTVNQPASINPNGSNLAYFEITLPAGLKSVTATASWPKAGQGAFLYLDKGASPLNPDCSTRTGGQTSATCTRNNPPAGKYYAVVSTQDAGGTIVLNYQ